MLDGLRSRCTTSLRVRVRDRLRHLQEHAKTRAHVEALVVAVLVDRTAFDVLERQIRPAAGRHARVVQPRDVRVVERGEDVALPRHALGERRARPGAARQLQRHGAPDHPVRALGQPHRAHAAFAQLAQQTIRTDVAPAWSPVPRRRRSRRDPRSGRAPRKSAACTDGAWASSASRRGLNALVLGPERGEPPRALRRAADRAPHRADG